MRVAVRTNLEERSVSKCKRSSQNLITSEAMTRAIIHISVNLADSHSIAALYIYPWGTELRPWHDPDPPCMTARYDRESGVFAICAC